MKERGFVVYAAAVLALVAALAHFLAMPGHFEEWWGYGVFFLATATAQGLYGVALLRWPRPSLFFLGVFGNLAVIVLYVVTRTVGIPIFGPHAGEIEGIGVIDLTATMAEVALVVALAGLLRSGQRPNTVVESAQVGKPRVGVSRRDFLRTVGVAGAVGISGGALGLRAAGGMGALGVAGAAMGISAGQAAGQESTNGGMAGNDGGAMGMSHGGNGTAGDVDTSRFDPTKFLRDFDYGEERREGGRTVREYELTAEDVEIEVAPGVMYPAWAYNGQVPGPTLRATEGDRLRIVFKNDGAHPHTIHFHGFHPANMDGVFELVAPGEEFVYEFDAEPFGCHLYHCHVMPLKKHIEKGLYGAFIIDPKEGRPEADELVMVMNGFDTNFDRANEVYAVNTVAFHYQKNPIEIKRGALIRAYVVNVLEFDFINSIHLHANFFDYYPTGTKLEPSEFTDTKMLAQGERGIMEFRYDRLGRFMFHAHVSEFAELGWMSLFDVKE